MMSAAQGQLPPTSERKPVVLFLCTANSARSQMAEAFLKRYAGDSFEVLSAGARPTGIHPLTTEVMNEIGLDVSNQRAKGFGEFLGKVSVHHAVIVCREVEPGCPTTWPFALSLTRWPFDDPAMGQGSRTELLPRFRAVRDQIDAKIRDWLRELGVGAARSLSQSRVC